MFHVDKWYLDVITDRGTAVILYAARVEWGRLHVDYASVLRASKAGEPQEASTIRHVEQPRIRGNLLAWRNAPLDVDGEWQREARPIRRTLASGSDGDIRWTCQMPRARARVRCGDQRFEGLGYVERLDLTIPPSKLPFRALRWGRHVSSAHSLIWIDWAGDRDRRWIWLDGEEQRAALLSGGVPSGLTSGAALYLRDRRDVRDRPVLAVLDALPRALARRVAGGIAGMHEHKMVSQSSIVIGGVEVDEGWSLHEVVTRPEARGSRSSELREARMP